MALGAMAPSWVEVSAASKVVLSNETSSLLKPRSWVELSATSCVWERAENCVVLSTPISVCVRPFSCVVSKAEICSVLSASTELPSTPSWVAVSPPTCVVVSHAIWSSARPRIWFVLSKVICELLKADSCAGVSWLISVLVIWLSCLLVSTETSVAEIAETCCVAIA